MLIYVVYFYDVVMVFVCVLNVIIFSSEGNVRNGRDFVVKI